MRKDAGRQALRFGLLVSILLHLVFVILDPGVEITVPAGSRHLRILPAERVGRLSTSSDDARAPAAPSGRTPASTDSTLLALSAPGEPMPDSAAAGSRERTVLERLTPRRDPLLWRRPLAPRETKEERALRELAMRLEQAGNEPSGNRPDEWAVLGRRGPVEIIAGRGGIGARIAVGRKPPPPARVIPAPPRLATLTGDSVRPRGERVYAYYDGYWISLPARLLADVAFEVGARFPGPVDSALVRFFVDDSSQADVQPRRGNARAMLRIPTPGEHRIRVQFLGSGYAPVQVLHTVMVEAGPALP